LKLTVKDFILTNFLPAVAVRLKYAFTVYF